MRQFTQKTNLILFFTVFSLLFATICPYICTAAPIQVSNHDCCPDSDEAQKTQEKAADECCKDELYTLQKDSIIKHISSATLPIFTIVINDTLEINELPLSFTKNSKHPPGMFSGQSVYLSKQSFLI
jgi:hypothetical protein